MSLSPAKRLPLSLLLVAAVGSACVSRNVERIPADEAAAMPAPPAPLSEDQSAASVVEVPGIDGTVSVAPGHTAPSAAVLFVLVRVAGRQTGPPLAVKQLPGEVPTSFRISEADAMIPGTPFVGDLDVIVRLDQDGNAFSRQPGDLEGRFGPVQVGGTVQIELAPAAVEATAGPEAQ